MRTPHIWHRGETMKDIEKDVILSALRQCEGNLTELCSELGVSRGTIYRRLKEFGLSTRHEIHQFLRRDVSTPVVTSLNPLGGGRF